MESEIQLLKGSTLHTRADTDLLDLIHLRVCEISVMWP